MRTQKQFDKRDRKLLHAVWLATVNALHRASHGHNDGWQKLEKALGNAEDEMGSPEDFIP